MCGIAGKIYFDNNRVIDQSELKEMTDVIKHRGPDDEGFFTKDNVGLGFRRLSIIDLNTGHQPLSNEDDSIWIVFNGEIYNFPELREMLTRQGHQFKTKTDTEAIIHLYEQFGYQCLEHLRGMFAFALYDTRKKILFCARDRFGKKPFYYFLDHNKFIFGSEMKVILKNEKIDPAISYCALDDYFAYGYIMGDKSIYKSIKKLPAAHYLTIDLNKKEKFNIKRYWDFSFQPDFSRTESQWEEEIISLLSESVKMRMISDVPLGAFLSGGIDSSSIVALMAKNSTSRIKTFSIGFNESEYNELPYAREIAAKYNTEHYEQIVEPESVDLLPKLVSAYDEPFADSSAVPTYYVSKFAREHVTVVLSGDGGDELFAGYDTYSRFSALDKLQFLPDKINRLLFEPLYHLAPFSMRGKKAMFYYSRANNRMGAHYTIWNNFEREALYRPELWNEIRNLQAEEFKVKLWKDSSSNDFISKLQELDLRTYLVDDILTKVDRASMMNSLEVRVPMLDHKFAEMTFRIPHKFKFHKGIQKRIFKNAMKPYLTDNVFQHKKQGFAIPLKPWFRKDLNDYINDRLLNKNSHLSRYLDPKMMSKVLKSNEYGKRNLGYHLWSLLFLECWFDQAADQLK
jgi:asparagine synthase (glutamine-hydrolysing)